MQVLTLTPFYPSAGDEATGCFVAESNRELLINNVVSTVVAARPLHYSRRRSNKSSPAEWVRYPQVPGNLGLSSAGYFLFARLLGPVRALHRQRRFDVIHAHAALPCGHAAKLLSKVLKIPFVLTVHGLDVFNTCFQRGLGVGGRHKISAKVYAEASRVICISQKVQSLVVEGMGDQVRTAVVYNGTDTQRFAPSEATPDDNTILIVGNLQRGKGHELVLRAIAQLRSRYGGLRCRIVGEGPDGDRFEALAKELGIEQSVEFLGRRGRDAVAEEMSKAAVFVLPSRYEALGCAYLEAMSCGRAVIACRGQGIEEIIRHGENGWLIPIDGLEPLVDGLSKLRESAELRTRLGRAARQTIVNGMTLAHQARELRQIYEEVAG